MNSLETFGKSMVEETRDKTISEYSAIKNCKMKSESARHLAEQMDSIDGDRMDKIVVEFIDRTIFNMLWMFEDSDYSIIGPETKEDILSKSDGLTGELYGKKGWIKRFSKFKDVT